MGKGENYYDKLSQRYRRVIPNKSLEYTILIDGKKKECVENLYDDIEFIKYTSDYIAIFKVNEIFEKYFLEFAQSHMEDSSCFFHYIMEFLTSKEQYFYKKVNGIILKDFQKEILHIKELSINNLIIDNKMIKLLMQYFKELEFVHFKNCIILEECSFYHLESTLRFYNCEIMNINSFNYCKQNLIFSNCQISKIVNAIINSSKITIDKWDDATLTDLFLKCHFPNLTEMIIKNDFVSLDDNTLYNKCLQFLPYACPNLVNLFIEGKVFSFNFLYHFNKLNKCEIRSVNDSIGVYEIYNPYVENDSERNDIINNSNRQIKDDMDIHLAIYDKLDEIIKLLKIANFTVEEMNIYLNKKVPMTLLNPVSNFCETKISNYYLYNLNNRILELCNNSDYEPIIINDRFYLIKKLFAGKYVKMKQGVIISSPFIYHPSGIPIIFSKTGYSYQQYIDDARRMQDYFEVEEDVVGPEEENQQRKNLEL